jgi:glycosyltransferase involved in cell wall biosynthesis
MAVVVTEARANAQPPLRLLMLSHYFAEHRGGVEIVAGALARGLANQNIDVIWAATGEGGPSESSSLRRLPLLAWNGAERAVGVPYPVLLPSAWRQVFAAVAGADVVIAHDALYLSSVAGFLAARLRNKPFIVIQHIGTVPYRNPILRGLMAAANRLVAAPILARADQTVFISELTRRHFEAIRWRRQPLLFFNGVDTTMFTPPGKAADVARARGTFGLPAAGPIALFVGRFVEKKGLPLLERIARANPEISFACAGWGPLDPHVWGLSNVRVFSNLSGHRLAELYRACDALILPSVGEGFPLVIQEALAAGLPVVCGAETATADPEAARFIIGVPFDADAPEAAAGAFGAALRGVMGAAPRDAAARSAFARERYNWAETVARYAQVARDLTGPSRK